MVSNQGLVFTNHHCGFDAIQQRSTVKHNYLKDGFTAEKQTDEIPCPGLTVKFLVKIQDVTERVISQLPDSLLGSKRTEKIDSISKKIQKEVEKEAEKGSNYSSRVYSFTRNIPTFALPLRLQLQSASSVATPTTGCGPAIPATFPFSVSIVHPMASLQNSPMTMCLIHQNVLPLFQTKVTNLAITP
jgi:hypothetical protein